MKTSTDGLVLAPDAAIDLQLHTVYSDGKWMPEQLIDHLMSEGFALAAITDHDRVDIVASLQQLALKKGFPLLAAVEMTTSWRGDMVDVLCYGFDPENNTLNALAQDLLRRQQENLRQVYDTLVAEGYTFTTDDDPDPLTAVLEKPSAQQPHAFVDLVKKRGYGTPEKSVGRIVLGAGLKFALNEIATVVEAAHQSGAVCLLAHPGRDDIKLFDIDLLDELRRDVPIDGLEVYYPAHTPEQTAAYLDYAQKHNLLTSSGSDSHTPDNLPVKYRADLSRKLLERVGVRVN